MADDLSVPAPGWPQKLARGAFYFPIGIAEQIFGGASWRPDGYSGGGPTSGPPHLSGGAGENELRGQGGALPAAPAGPTAPTPTAAPAAGGPGFTDVLKAPEVQAALIQFGINMLTPSYSGFGAQLGKSLGQAGAAAGRASAKKQKDAETARNQELQEREFGLSKRRVDLTEREVARREKTAGKSLQSMFSKAKPFQTFLTDQAQDDYLTWTGPNGETYDTSGQLANDPVYQQEMLTLWRKTSGIGLGGTTEMSSPESNGLAPGTVEEGFRFLGGDPSDPNNWEPE